MENNEIINNEVVEQTTDYVVAKASDSFAPVRVFGTYVMLGAATGLGVALVFEGVNKVKLLLARRKLKKEAVEYEYTVDGEKVEMVDDEK